MGLFQVKELEERGLLPLKGDDLNDDYLNTSIDWIPGMKSIRLKDLPVFTEKTDPNNIIFNLCKEEPQAAHLASAFIINTFDDLEFQVLEAMASFLPPIYAVGPLTLLCHEYLKNQDNLIEIGSNNLWKEDTRCLQWLQGRAPKSVIYLNFGSIATMTDQQITEFAWGLSKSGYDFLWVIRPDVVENSSSILSKEFLEETSERGLLISWCPQEEVLMHDAIGGFLTHCGWNSMMESVSAGVPMLCWPYFGDQYTNCRYACNEWGIGIEVDNNVRRNEVASLIRELMEGDKGKEMRKNAIKWKESAVKAVQPGGKSYVNLDKVINEVLLKKEKGKRDGEDEYADGI